MANVSLLPHGANFYGLFYKLPGANSAEQDAVFTSWDFDNHWKCVIDAIKALGGNFMASAGVSYWETSGISQATYLSRRLEVVDYMAEVGMYFLPYGMRSFGGYNGATDQEVLDLITAEAAVMAKRPNVVGYVTMDEPWLGYTGEGGSFTGDEVVAKVAAQYAAVKAVVPTNFGVCSAPNPCGDLSGDQIFTYSGSGYGSSQGKCDSVSAYCDFFTFHPFYAVAANPAPTLRSTFPGKDFIFSSSVYCQQGDGDIATKMTAVMDTVGTTVIRGMGYFATLDYPGTPTDTSGMFTADGGTLNAPAGPITTTGRTTKTNAFTAALPTVVAPAHPVRFFPGNPRLNQLIRWGY